MFWKQKIGFGKVMKKVREVGFSWKRSGNAGSVPPPLPDPVNTLYAWILGDFINYNYGRKSNWHIYFLILLSKLLYHCFHEPMRTFIFWHLTNGCQIACPALISFPRNRTPYNKHFISLVFSILTVNYISLFFPNDIWPMCEKKRGHIIYSTDLKLG